MCFKMIDLSRVANNALAIFIVGGFGYIIYQGMQGNNVFGKFKEKMGRFTKRGDQK